MECKVIDVLGHGGVDYILIIIGEIIESYIDKYYLTNGNPDIEKIKSVLLSMYENRYFGIGKLLGKVGV